MLRAVCHSAQNGWKEVSDLSTLSELRLDESNLIWAEAEVSHLTDGDVELIAEEFGLHQLAVDDAMSPRQRPKLESYDDQIFIVLHQLDEVSDQLEASQLACFVGDRYVLALHDGAQRTLHEAKSRWREKIEHHRPAFLLHTLADVVVDDYGDIADRLENQIEGLEEIALDQPGVPLQRQLYRLKQQLARLRRYLVPSGRVIDSAMRESGPVELSMESRHFFRDVQDHVMRITDQLNNVEDLTQAVLELTRAAQADTLADINKKLSAWAAIFAVATLIAGIYGMNFALVPEAGELFGFWFAVALIVVLSVGLFRFFRHRGWL
jgi:magnesium transporter